MLIRRAVRFMFGSRTLFVTNVVSTGVMMGFGDWIVQYAIEKTDKNREKIDWARTGNWLSRVCVKRPPAAGGLVSGGWGLARVSSQKLSLYSVLY